MSYAFYKIIHLTGIVMVFLALGGALSISLSKSELKSSVKKWLMVSHGVGLLLALVAGFGLMARIGIEGWPTWIYFKIAIWLIFGASMGIAIKKQTLAKPLWVLFITFLVAASYFANYKPDFSQKESIDQAPIEEFVE